MHLAGGKLARCIRSCLALIEAVFHLLDHDVRHHSLLPACARHVTRTYKRCTHRLSYLRRYSRRYSGNHLDPRTHVTRNPTCTTQMMLPGYRRGAPSPPLSLMRANNS